MTKCWYRII